jgi:L-malate glycosyltransferase
MPKKMKNSQMKIGIVCYPSVGGSGVVATELGRHLASRGHEIHFISYEMPFRLQTDEANITFHQVEINRYDLFRYPDYALTLAVKMADVAKTHRLDLFHVHYAIPHATSAYLAKQMLGTHPTKTVTTLHGTDITLVGRDPAYFPIVKFSIDHSDGVTAVSQHLKQETIEHFHLSCPIEVIYNFFDPKPGNIRKKTLREKYAEPQEKLIVHASNFRNIKRTEEVIEIFRLIKSRLPAKLLLLGSGEDLEKTKTLAEFYQLEGDVHFIGNKSSVDPYMACGDLFLLPSEQESFGLVALEAMAYGVPVICSNVGGLSEVVQEGVNGFLLPVGDVAAMTERALQLLSDQKLHAEFSAAAKREAAAHFGADKIVTQYEAYYEKILIGK